MKQLKPAGKFKNQGKSTRRWHYKTSLKRGAIVMAPKVTEPQIGKCPACGLEMSAETLHIVQAVTKDKSVACSNCEANIRIR